MTTSFKDTMGADWYLGYDDKVNTSNFVAISTMPDGPAKDKAIALAQEEIIGLLEQKGVTRDQITGAKNPGSHVHNMFKDAMDRIEFSSGSNVATRNIFQDVAYSTTSAADRGDNWGGSGRDYLNTLAGTESTGAASLNEIADLYRQGFGREPDREGLLYWGSSGQSLQDIATAFRDSEEANIRTSYSKHYGRDIGDEGLNYWLEHTGEDTYSADKDDRVDTLSQAEGSAAKAFDASKLVERSLADRSNEYRQHETAIRDHGWLTMGQASSEAQRATLPTNTKDKQLFTDMETEQVLDWVSKVRSGDMTLQDITNQLTDRSDRMSAFNEGDRDDYTTKDINGDGIISEDEIQTGSPTGMGRFASLQEIQETIDSGETPDQIRERLGMQRWGLLTHENEKALEDFKRTSADYDKYRDTFTGNIPTPGGIYDNPAPGTETETETDWTPEVPTKPGIPPKPPVDRTSINYMPGVKPDPFDETPYGAAKKEFDTTKGQVQLPTQPLATQQVGQRFTGTSAKGVALKRSKRSKLGTIRGTKQLGREQQTQSLNI